MKISYNWLKQYIPLELKPEKVAEILTGTGLEVEGIEEFETVRGGLEGVVIGKVISCMKHPGADKLTLARVDTGRDNILNIVCGAPNVRVGQKVPVATEGATLYSSNRSITIKRSKIRGEISEGMICAEDELGLGDSHDGIMVLDDGAVPGTPAADYFTVEKDIVFEIGLTPNRIDAASHYGVARDLAAWIGQEKEINLIRPTTDSFRPDNNKHTFEIIISNPEACIRYSGLTIWGVKVAPSPRWLQNRLRAIGLKPINNIVDITNYVLHETGHPLHAFNADKVKGNKVIIGHLPGGTRFRTLDEIDRVLSEEDLMICNENEGMCIAGIFGGVGSGVNESTSNIFLESACFDPVYIRKSSRRHGLNTDASFRFERGADPSATVYVLKRAAMMIKEIAGGEISSDVTDVYPNPVNPVRMDLDYDYTNRLIGGKLPRERIKRILGLLDFRILRESDTLLSLEVPLYRVDVTRPADVVEEILRIYGYNRISVPGSVRSNLSYSVKPDREKYEHAVSDMLSSLGFNEIISNSLTRSSNYENSEEFHRDRLVRLINPLSADLDCMRQSLLFGGLEAVLYNTNRKNPDLKLYEFGNVYSYSGNSKETGNLEKYIESRHLALFMTGDAEKKLWNSLRRQSAFHDIKGYVYQVMRRTGLEPEGMDFEESDNETLLYGLKLIAGKSLIAQFGTVHPVILEKADLKNEVFYADIYWDNLVKHAAEEKVTFRELPKFPEVKRDLAMELDKDVKFQTLKDIAYQTEKKLLRKLTLFDIYEGSNIAKGKKSLAVSFVLQDVEGTLKDSLIDSVMEKLAGAFEKKAGARIRR